jgi:hypothetical protein
MLDVEVIDDRRLRRLPWSRAGATASGRRLYCRRSRTSYNNRRGHGFKGHSCVVA